MKLRRIAGCLIGASLGLALFLVFPGSVAAQAPAPPAAFVDTTLPVQTGSTIAVPAGGSFQAALNNALPGDVITLAAGATFTGPFVLPNKSGAGWITIRSSAADSVLPAPGTRVRPANAANMPKIVGPGGGPAIQTAHGAHHFRFIAIEFKPAAGTYTQNLIALGAGDTSTATLPHHLVFDRCYIHGDPTTGGKRGIAMNSATTAVIDSHLSDWKGNGMDTQAIAAWNGPGPFKIVNNYLEGSGENVLIGGADPSISNLVPSDIEFRRNHVAKNPAWNQHDASRYAGVHWLVKNIFELKNAQRVLIDGNVFEHNWADAQNGFSILFTVRNQDGTAPWSVVQDVTFTNNVLRHAAAGINILGVDNLAPSLRTRRILIRNNVFDDIGASIYAGNGTLLQMLHGAANVTFDHNTALQRGSIVMADMDPSSGFVFTNNITPNNLYGVVGSGTGTGLSTLNAYFPGYVFRRNVIIGGAASAYPADNFFPASTAAVGFVDASTGNYRLSTASPYNDAATDGTDIGANLDAITAAQGDTGSGGGGDTTVPTVTITAPAAGSTVSGSVAVTATASDNVGVVGVRFQVNGTDLGTEDTAAPYTRTWDTTTVANGTYPVRAVVRDAAGNTRSASISVTVSNTTGGGGGSGTGTQNVVWVDVRNATVSANSVRKSAGCDGCADAGAASAQMISSGDGHLEFVPGGTEPLAYVGFTRGDVTYSGTALPFAIRVQGGHASVRESGMFRAETPFAAGDRFRIAVEDGRVRYKKNGTVFYTSARTPGYPLRGDAVLYDSTASVSGAVIATGASAATDTTAPIVTITSPANDATVTGTVTLRATATDNVGVTRVTFWASNQVVGTADTVAPYERSWDTSVVPTGWYTIKAVSRDDAGNLSETSIRVQVARSTASGSVENVVWTNVVNATVSGSLLTKSGGCDGCPDAGAGSTQTIASGNGYFEFTAAGTAPLVFAGLTTGGTTLNADLLRFALSLQSGYATVWELGTYRADTTFATGDTFRIQIEQGVVKYRKNGTVFYTSTTAPAYPLRADAVLFSAGGSITAAKILAP